MMISNLYIVVMYFFSLILFLNFNNPIFFWILMELNLISFTLVMSLTKIFGDKQEGLSYLIFYFVIQSSASILFLSNFSLMEWVGIFNCDVMFIVCMLFKIGLFPLFFWVFSLSESISNFSLICLLSFQKIPLFCGLFYNNSSLLYIFLSLSFVFGSLMLFFSQSFLSMLICSSISYSFLLFFLYICSGMTFIIFFFFYSLSLFFLLLYTDSYTTKSCSFILLSSFIFFLGLPPLGLFFYKFIFTNIAFALLGPTEVYFFWIFSFFSLMGYIKFFFHSFFFLMPLRNSSPQSSFILIFTSFSSFLFLILSF